MSYFKFKQNDILYNSLKLYPQVSFDSAQTKVYLNHQTVYSGTWTDNITHVPQGFLSLNEKNVDRDFSSHTYSPTLDSGIKTKIFPFTYKDSDLFSPSTMANQSFHQDYGYGAIITGSYELSASILRTYYSSSQARPKVNALKTTLDYYRIFGEHHQFSSSLGDKGHDPINTIEIPKIFFDNNLKKGSVSLSFYISGTLLAQCSDLLKNGQLYETTGPNVGDVAGVCLYNLGVILLTGSWDLSPDTYLFDSGMAHTPRWLDFMAGTNDGLSSANLTPSASFNLTFEGTSVIPTMTLFCNASKGELNYTTNPTYVQFSGSSFDLESGSNYFSEKPKNLKNIVSSSFYDYEESFKKTTYISKVLVYDEEKNLVGVANLARPLKKTEDRDYTIKLKMDF